MTKKLWKEFSLVDRDSNAMVDCSGKEAARFREASGRWGQRGAWATTAVAWEHVETVMTKLDGHGER